MRDEINRTVSFVEDIKQKSLQLNMIVSGLTHKDLAIRNYTSKLKKLSLQSLDLFNEVNRQLNFLNNAYKSYLDRESRRKY